MRASMAALTRSSCARICSLLASMVSLTVAAPAL